MGQRQRALEGLGVTSAARRRVLLTGAAGFIGAHVTRQLVSAGHEVTVILRPQDDRGRIADVLPRVTVVEGDLARLDPMLPQLAEIGRAHV